VDFELPVPPIIPMVSPDSILRLMSLKQGLPFSYSDPCFFLSADAEKWLKVGF